MSGLKVEGGIRIRCKVGNMEYGAGTTLPTVHTLSELGNPCQLVQTDRCRKVGVASRIHCGPASTHWRMRGLRLPWPLPVSLSQYGNIIIIGRYTLTTNIDNKGSHVRIKLELLGALSLA